ncbi:glycosyltransferase family 4 protein [Leifsonia aquatica]|uniref:glycosyltransferase family 4 protein n=1 Tax=Leifsonia aquatica TaxID=144185 RepID=UPI00046AB37E|nr:glycosyltransferase family 4 protein [Leifsonia aquatica]
MNRGGLPSVAIVYDCLYPYTTGGGERVYTEIAARLAARGHRVDYLTRTQWDGDTPDAPFGVVPIWKGEISNESGDRLPASAAAFARAVHRALRQRRGEYDIVIVSALPPLNVFAARAALRRTGTWLVGDWLEIWTFRKWRQYSGPVVGTVASLLQRSGLRRSDEVTVNSEFTLERARYRLRSGGGLVLGLVDLVKDPGVSDPTTVRRTVLFAGRHIPDKQLDVLPAAVAVAREAYPDVRLVVTGSGSETQRLQEAASIAGVDVEVRGRVSDDELERLMDDAAVLVNPSRREGFGLVIAEAASHGTPSVVVAGEDNAAAELVEDGVNGFVAGSTDPDILGRAIIAALEGGPAMRESSRTWYERSRSSRSLDASIDELLARYDAFTARRKASSVPSAVRRAEKA